MSGLQPDRIPPLVMETRQHEVLDQAAVHMGYYEGPPVTTKTPFPPHPIMVPPPVPSDHVESGEFLFTLFM